MSSFLWFY